MIEMNILLQIFISWLLKFNSLSSIKELLFKQCNAPFVV